MVGSNGTIMTMRIIRSKLRKREESSSAAPGTIESQPTANFGQQSRSNSADNNCHHQQIFTTSVTVTECNNINNNDNVSSNKNNNNNNSNNNNNGVIGQEQVVAFTRISGNNATNGWVFPPKAPTPNIHHCMTNNFLMVDNDQNGFKGFRKQFSGRFKRLVTKKPEILPTIPPELKPQLKTIYVY